MNSQFVSRPGPSVQACCEHLYDAASLASPNCLLNCGGGSSRDPYKYLCRLLQIGIRVLVVCRELPRLLHRPLAGRD